MPKKSWKKAILSWGGIATLFLGPIAAIACGDDTMTQVQVNKEQEIINNLGGIKKIDTSKAISPVNSAVFTVEIANRFGLENFVAKSGFTYLYSHGALNQDGIIPLIITVKNELFTATNAIDHKIMVIGLDLAQTKSNLANITMSSQNRENFLAITMQNQILDEATSADLGIILPAIGAGVVVRVNKTQNSTIVAYNLTKANQSSQALSVNFQDFSSNLAQSDVDVEQANLNNITGLKKWVTYEVVQPVSNLTFNTTIASKWGLNFIPKPGFTYTYSHNGVSEDGNLVVLLKVKGNDLIGSNPMPIVINVQGLNLAKAKTQLETITMSSKTENSFKSLIINNETLVADTISKLGVGTFTLPIGVEVKVSKLANSKIVTYLLSKDDLSLPTFSVTFTDFPLFQVDQATIDAQQAIINALGGPKAISITEPIMAQAHTPFTTSVATFFQISNFVPEPGLWYYYSHGNISEDGTFDLTIVVEGNNLIATNPIAHQVNVDGLDFARTKSVLLNTLITTKNRHDFYSVALGNDSPLNVANKALLGIDNIAISDKVTVKVSKVTNSFDVIYNIQKNGQSETHSVAFETFQSYTQAEVDAEQTRASQLTGNLVYRLDAPLNANLFYPLNQAMVSHLNLDSFELHQGFLYWYSVSKNISIVGGSTDVDVDSGKLYIYVLDAENNLHDSRRTPQLLTKVVVKIQGININQTKRTLEKVLSTNQTMASFQTYATNGEVDFDTTIANNLGLTMPTIAPGVTIKVTKQANSSKLTYRLIKDDDVLNFETEIVSFMGSITQANVDAEQTLINNLSGAKRYWTALPNLVAKTNAIFDSEVAQKFGLTNFIPKPGYSYQYSHNALNSNGTLNVTIKVSVNNLVASQVASFSIAVAFESLQNVSDRLVALKSTTYSAKDFAQRLLAPNEWVVSDYVPFNPSDFGIIEMLELPSDIKLHVYKRVGNSMIFEYFLSNTDQSDELVTITIVNFKT